MKPEVSREIAAEFVVGDLKNLVSDYGLLINFVYGLREPGSSTIRYIGITNKPFERHYRHLRNSHNPLVREWVYSMFDEGTIVEMIILCATVGGVRDSAARAAEVGFITLNKNRTHIGYQHGGKNIVEWVDFDLLNQPAFGRMKLIREALTTKA